MRLERGKFYELERNKVNNLGLILWEADMNSRSHSITSNAEYVPTRQAFAERYPESLWSQREWVELRGK